jgi:hypothetical protein
LFPVCSGRDENERRAGGKREETRLDLTDPPSNGTNVIPLKINQKSLSSGYARLMADLYEPKAFFAHVDKMWLTGPLRAENQDGVSMRQLDL